MSHSVMLTQLANSGWTQCSSIARALTEAGIPVPTEAYLRSAFDISVWDTVATLSSDLSRHFQSYPFAEEAIYGPLLVSHARLFDVRRSQSRHIRSSQPEITKPDFVDERLPLGADHTDLVAPWTLFVTIISDAGLAMGSYNDITAQPRIYIHGQRLRHAPTDDPATMVCARLAKSPSTRLRTTQALDEYTLCR